MGSSSHGAAFVATRDEIEERRLFSKIISILRSHSISADAIPTLCLIGVQSHGKSSLVEFFVGMPLTLIKEDTGTRCPTKFFLQFNVDVKTPRCEIVKVPKEVSHLYPDVSVSSPMKADYKALPNALGKVMQEVEQHSANGFSIDELEVHVTSDLCPNLFFVDLPGIVSQIDPRCKTIESIVRTYLQMPSVIPIMVVKASEDLATGMLYSFIRDNARPGWKQSSLFVATHFDANLPKNGEALALKLEGHCCDPENPKEKRVLTKFFVSCNPPPVVDRAALMERKHDELIQRIRNLERLENDLIEQCLTEIRSSVHPEFDIEYWRPFLGLGNAKSAIKKQWYDSYTKQFPAVRISLQEKQRETAAKLAELRSLQSANDPDTIRVSVSKIASKFLNLVKLVTEQDASVWSSSMFGFKSSGVTFDEEDCLYKSSGERPFLWEREISQSQLQGIRGPSADWQLELDAKLLGSSQIRRLFNVNRAILCTAELPPINSDLWLNATGHFVKATTSPSWDHAVAQVVNWWLRELMVPSVHFMTSRILHIFKRIGTIIADSMKADAKFTGFHQFVDEVNEAFQEWVEKRVRATEAVAVQLVEAKSEFLDLSLSRNMAAVFATDSQTESRSVDGYFTANSEGYYSEGAAPDAPPAPEVNSDVSRRLRIMLGDHLTDAVQWPTTRSLDRESVVLVRKIAERCLLTQLLFCVHDIESLAICNIEKPIQNPMSTSGFSCDATLAESVGRVACQDADRLADAFQLDMKRISSEIADLASYEQNLAHDVVELDTTCRDLDTLYTSRRAR